ncbi:MAG: sulfur reduction protein DsrJ [Candidatus Thiodiazotropha sp.]|jgi:hypothetical protein
MRSSLIRNRCFLILLAGMLFPAMQATAESALVTKGSKAAGMDSCVAPTGVMRRNHMEFLKHGRDETVRGGVRGLDFSLAECIDCHAARDASGKSVPVNAKGQFCQVCHAYVAASPDCFQCHRTTPQAQPMRFGYHEPESVEAFPESQTSAIQRD